MDTATSATPATLDSICVLVADHCYARFFTAAVPEAPLIERKTLENPSARLHESGLISDHGGRVSSSTRRGGHTVGEPDGARRHLAENFAKTVCQELKEGRIAGRYARIHMVAERGFLGLLRAELDRPTLQIVVSQVGKDMSRAEPADIRELLPRRL